MSESLWFSGFTSRGVIGAKLLKTRLWDRRVVRAPCLVCRRDCGTEASLAKHRTKHTEREIAGSETGT